MKHLLLTGSVKLLVIKINAETKRSSHFFIVTFLNIYHKLDKAIQTNGMAFLNTERRIVMSVVIAIIERDQVIMACDTQITSGGVRRRGVGKSNYKIWHPNSKELLLMGTTGLLREKNVIQTCTDLIKNHEYIEGKIDFQFIVQKVVKRLIDEQKSAGLIDEKVKPFQMNNRYLLAYKNQLFEIDKDGAVIEINDYTAIGSAANEALASLHASLNEESEVRILKAMKSARMNDIYVSGPIIIGTTKDNEFKRIQNEEERFDEQENV